MTAREAHYIFAHIESEICEPEEKCEAIRIVCDMPTHISVTKESCIRVLKWLLGLSAPVAEGTKEDE